MTAATDKERIAELEEDNARLRRLLDQGDAPGELRHRLRSTLALLRAVVRRSANGGRDLAGYVAQLEDRLDAITRAQALADQHGEVDLRTLVTDELFQYGVSEGGRLLLSGPGIRFQPRAGQILALGIHELAVNAVEHGTLGSDKGQVEVSWALEPGDPPTLLLSWIETGLATSLEPVRRGFGTEVLTRMLPYELKAETENSFGPGGLRCTVRLLMPPQVGRAAPW